MNGWLSMREINALGADILTSNKKISLPVFTPPIVLPLYEITDERVLPATGVVASASAVCIFAAVQGTTPPLVPNSVSPVKFKAGQLDSPPPRFIRISYSDSHEFSLSVEVGL